MVSVQTAEKSPTGRFFWKVRVVCSLRGLFSYKSPLFFNPSFVLKNSPAKALPRTMCFALCGVRPKTLSLESVSFLKKAQPKTFRFRQTSECDNASERRVLNPKQYTKPKRETALVLSQKVPKAPENSGAFL